VFDSVRTVQRLFHFSFFTVFFIRFLLFDDSHVEYINLRNLDFLGLKFLLWCVRNEVLGSFEVWIGIMNSDIVIK